MRRFQQGYDPERRCDTGKYLIKNWLFKILLFWQDVLQKVSARNSPIIYKNINTKTIKRYKNNFVFSTLIIPYFVLRKMLVGRICAEAPQCINLCQKNRKRFRKIWWDLSLLWTFWTETKRDHYDKNEQESYVAYFMIEISLKFTEDPILACIVDTFIMT